MDVKESVSREIRRGVYDDELDEMATAIRDRKTHIRPKLYPGDTVHFSDVIRPRYLVGKEAIVVRVSEKSITVRCPDDLSYQRYRGAPSVRCPNTLIQELN